MLGGPGTIPPTRSRSACPYEPSAGNPHSRFERSRSEIEGTGEIECMPEFVLPPPLDRRAPPRQCHPRAGDLPLHELWGGQRDRDAAAAQMYLIYATLHGWGLIPYRRRQEYLAACAELSPSRYPGRVPPEQRSGSRRKYPWHSSIESSPTLVGHPARAADLRLAPQIY